MDVAPWNRHQSLNKISGSTLIYFHFHDFQSGGTNCAEMSLSRPNFISLPDLLSREREKKPEEKTSEIDSPLPFEDFHPNHVFFCFVVPNLNSYLLSDAFLSWYNCLPEFSVLHRRRECSVLGYSITAPAGTEYFLMSVFCLMKTKLTLSFHTHGGVLTIVLVCLFLVTAAHMVKVWLRFWW